MASIMIDRTDGLSSSTAIKGPVRCATTANISLTGTQTIDGVAVVADDRVLVKNQTTASENGIYVVDTGPWRRAKDFSGNRDVKKGSRVAVTDGTANAGKFFTVTSANPIVVGTTSISFGDSANTGTAPGNIPLLTNTNEAVAALENVVIDDRSTVLRSLPSQYWPTYFANAGTGRVHRMNRLLVGTATANSSDRIVGPPTTTQYDWLNEKLNIVTAATLAAASPVGGHGVVGATRTSDYDAVWGSNTGGAQGVTGFAVNDDPSGNSIAAGVVAWCTHEFGSTGITEALEAAIDSAISPVDIGPYIGITGVGSTIAGNFTVGHGNFPSHTERASAHINLGGSVGARKGIVAKSNSLDPAVGSGGNGVFTELAVGQSTRWVDSGGTSRAEFWGETNGGLTVKDKMTVRSADALQPSLIVENTANDSTAGNLVLRNTRGGAAAQASDTLGQIVGQGLNTGLTATTACYMQLRADGAAGASTIAGSIGFFTAPSGGAATERLRINSLGDMVMPSGNVIIDSDRLHRLRVYTVATLPAAGTAGRTAAVSDATAPTYNAALTGGGAVFVPVVDNGAAWRSA